MYDIPTGIITSGDFYDFDYFFITYSTEILDFLTDYIFLQNITWFFF